MFRMHWLPLLPPMMLNQRTIQQQLTTVLLLQSSSLEYQNRFLPSMVKAIPPRSKRNSAKTPVWQVHSQLVMELWTTPLRLPRTILQLSVSHSLQIPLITLKKERGLSNTMNTQNLQIAIVSLKWETTRTVSTCVHELPVPQSMLSVSRHLWNAMKPARTATIRIPPPMSAATAPLMLVTRAHLLQLTLATNLQTH